MMTMECFSGNSRFDVAGGSTVGFSRVVPVLVVPAIFLEDGNPNLRSQTSRVSGLSAATQTLLARGVGALHCMHQKKCDA